MGHGIHYLLCIDIGVATKVLEPEAEWVDLSTPAGMAAAPYPYHISLGYNPDWDGNYLNDQELRDLRALSGMRTVFLVERVSEHHVAMLRPDHPVLQNWVVQKCHAKDWHRCFSVSM